MFHLMLIKVEKQSFSKTEKTSKNCCNVLKNMVIELQAPLVSLLNLAFLEKSHIYSERDFDASSNDKKSTSIFSKIRVFYGDLLRSTYLSNF
jgi:hypothetical protein